MYRTTLYNLSEDLEHASPEFGQRELGEINAEEMHSLLEFLRHIDPVELHEAQPFVSIVSPNGRYTVRASSGKLHLYDIARPELGSCELDPPALIQQISPKFERVVREGESRDLHLSKRRSVRFNQGIAIVMLLTGLLLNGYTLYAAFYIDDVHRAPPLTLVTEPREVQRLRDTMTGTYATGNLPGDRAIVIKPNGTADLIVLGSKTRTRLITPCTYSLGKREGRLFLSLKPRGQIEVTSMNQISLYGDLYRRSP